MTKKKYNHVAIETKWQKYWSENKTFKTKLDHSKKKYYVLDMFPYPSGAGLHVGHVTGYTATDIVARFKRQKGFNVLHPMGWDSFGLPAEQYAVRTGTHPKITTEKNINTYRRQLSALGFSYDWSREIATSDPNYYKWTQWIFTKLYEKGLAYETEALVNYCPALGTVLSNEEIEDGKAKEGGFPIERRPLKQWMLKITAYAERLLKDLDKLDWPDYLKRLQRNWIGRSEGARIRFPLENGEKIEVFTTRHDTYFGTTYLVLAPEHPLVATLTTEEQKGDVDAYLKETAKKSDLDRTDLNKEKTGVFTGSYAKLSLSGKKIPIWIADYVIMGYGSGAVMGVPANCDRDFDFAKKYDIEMVPVVDPDLDTHADLIPKGMDKELYRKDVCSAKDWWMAGGTIMNSPGLDGLSVEAAKKKIVELLKEQGCADATVSYRLRDWLFSRQRYWGEPFPILHYENGEQRTLDLDELPLTLPEISDFKPEGDGKTPLAKAKDWVGIKDPKTGDNAKRELNVMPQWAGSCWYYLRFLDPDNDKMMVDPEKEKYWMPVDLYVGGVEHAVLHLLYARFWHKVLFDIGVVSTDEPFQSLRNQGLVTSFAYKKPGGGYVTPDAARESGDTSLIKTVEKMSKSKLNGVSPDEIIQDYGADTLRLYEMFMAPFDKEKLWNPEAISGCQRFLNRFWDLVHSDKISDEEDADGMRHAHRLVSGVEKDIEGLFFNTAIAKMMEFINQMQPLAKYPRKALIMASQALSPFAPHIAEECYEFLTGNTGISFVPFPEADPKLLEDDTVTYVAQINGKVRARFDLPKGLDEETLLSKVKEEPNIQRFLEGTIAKVIYVPNKLINIVVK